jgi:hypothetical protein
MSPLRSIGKLFTASIVVVTLLPDGARAEDAQSTLGTPEQIAAERFALRVLALPRTQSIWQDVTARLKDDPASAHPEGRATLQRALMQWSTSLAVRHSAGDTARPAVLWTVDTTPHAWHGHEFPGAAAAGDNPDNIYRTAFIDGGSRYEIHGSRPSSSPVQFSVEITHAAPGQFMLKQQSAKTPDLGDQVAVLSDRSIRYEPDGRFVITLDSEPAKGRANHLQLTPGALSVIFRDTRTDWNQSPYEVHIRRVSGTTATNAPTEQQLIERTLADLPDYLMFWAQFKNSWLGAPKPNTLAGPLPRDGGWGFLAGGHFDLADDEALLARINPADARYVSAQVTDSWFITNDSRKAFTSLNIAQVAREPNGEIYYVISLKDPGAPNWIGTSGLRKGMMVFRWQQIATGTQANQLVREFKRVKLSELRSLLPAQTKWIAADARAGSLQQRAAAYEKKLVQ